jgi:PAS domain S-box-containing protein/diguanylate cyclase (GGDEF)-like protein
MFKRISSITLILAIVIASLFSIVIPYSQKSLSDNHLEKNKTELKKLFTKTQKELIQQEINRIAARITLKREQALLNAKAEIRQRVELAESFIKSIDHHSEDEQKHMMDSMTHAFKWNNESGYYFIVDKSQNILYHGGSAKFEGKNIKDIIKKDDRLMSFIKKTLENGNAYGEYFFEKPYSEQKFHKLSYAKVVGNVLVGSGVYIDEIERNVQSELLNELDFERFGYKNYGYFWIINTDYKIVYHINPGVFNVDNYNFKDTDGKYIFREFIDIALEKGEGFSKYYWPFPGTTIPVEKISYVKLIPEWNWVIGTGFYFENFKELAASEREVMENTVNSSLFSTMVIVAILFILTIIAALHVYLRVRNIEDEQKIYINDLLQYKIVLDESSIVSITDTDGVITYVNDKLVEISGYSKKELVGHRHTIMKHHDTPDSVYKDLWETITRGEVWKGIIKNMRSNGDYFYHNITVIPHRNSEGEVDKYISCSQDVTEVFENRNKLQEVFSVDSLTGLGNRFSLLQTIKKSKEPTLAMIDIDRFHDINETYGMQSGDALLNLFSIRLGNCESFKNYSLFRLHSDVFAILASDEQLDQFVDVIAENIKFITSKPFKVEDKEIMIRVRIGFAHDHSDPLSYADTALQLAKRENRNYSVYDPDLNASSQVYEENIKIMKMINDAIENDRVVPYYQPIYNFETGKIEKFESLMRIIDKDKRLVTPFEFLDISKQTRFYQILTQRIFQKTVDTFTNLKDYEFSINLSTEDLLNQDTMEYILEYGKEKGVLNRMVIEIVESEQISMSAKVSIALAKLKKEGVKIAIDDFGTGYSNFEYLLKIKADYVKIDGSIIKLINRDERAVDILTSIVNYSEKIGMKTIGEFISNQPIAKQAKILGVNYAQGYYIGKPEPTPNPEPDNTI